METARERTSTSRGFRLGTPTAGRTSRTSGPPNRGNITALHDDTAAVEAVLSPTAGARSRRPPSCHMAGVPHPTGARLRLTALAGRDGGESGPRGRGELSAGVRGRRVIAVVGLPPSPRGGEVSADRPRTGPNDG
ncbi:hypothetical protein BHE74_00042522, partial [Ensete ventricosum]